MRTSQKRKKLHGGLNFLNTEENNQQKNVIINKRTLLPTHADTQTDCGGLREGIIVMLLPKLQN